MTGRGPSRSGTQHCAVRAVAVLTLLACPMSAAEATLSGRVVDENGAPVPGARVIVAAQLATSSKTDWEGQTDPVGAFSFTLPGPGDFLVNIENQGYYALKDNHVHIDTTLDVRFVINRVSEVFQSENVKAEISPADVEQAQNQEHLTGTEVNNMPYASSHSLRSSLKLMPGVVEDASGTLHTNGSSENQVQYLLNGFDINNPISGQFQTLLAIEGIRSVDLSSGRYSPQYGKGSAGVMGINTASGTDTFHYTATDFIPAPRLQQGLGVGNWFPRFGASGPILRGRAWFSDTLDAEWNQSIVTGLPSNQNVRSGFASSNLLHTQVNVSASNILFADFLINTDNEGRVGLGPLNPVDATSNVHTRQYFGSIRDQQYFGRGLLMEFGYSHSDYSMVQSPQGPGLYIYSPEGNGGNYFIDSTQGSSRDQGLIQAYLPKVQFGGSHQFEAGTDAIWTRYAGDFHRTGYEVFGLSNQLISETLYSGPAIFHTDDVETSAYLLDTWRVSKRLQFNIGIREDHDQRIGGVAWSPRVAFSWSPFRSDRFRVSGGYAITHDAVTMDMLGRPLDQTALTTRYNPDGTPIGPAALTSFTIPDAGLSLPRATNWTLAADHQLSTHFFMTAKYLRRRGTDGFAFINMAAPDAPPSLLPLPNSDSAGTYQLANLRRDDYDSVSVSIRQTLSGQFEWMATYTRSRALSNAVLDPGTSQPLQILPGFVPMPWDAPNRVLAWAYLPLPWKNWAISGLADMRTGFPFSVQDQTGLVAGAVDSYRYPLNFDLNIAIERMVTLRGYRFALRGGMNNVTNQLNPTAVNAVIGAPQYLQFLGAEGRHFVVRIRFFGRSSSK